MNISDRELKNYPSNPIKSNLNLNSEGLDLTETRKPPHSTRRSDLNSLIYSIAAQKARSRYKEESARPGRQEFCVDLHDIDTQIFNSPAGPWQPDTCHSSALGYPALRPWRMRDTLPASSSSALVSSPTLASLPKTTMKIEGMRRRKKIKNNLTSRKLSCDSLSHTNMSYKRPSQLFRNLMHICIYLISIPRFDVADQLNNAVWN